MRQSSNGFAYIARGRVYGHDGSSCRRTWSAGLVLVRIWVRIRILIFVLVRVLTLILFLPQLRFLGLLLLLLRVVLRLSLGIQAVCGIFVE